ncbi:hypothetical protein OG395_30600 [Streptomyces sp. NBC_01320]|nr:hypothetical protein OG395_30600 [Streptomyces sp. NBC_01320]
MVELIPLALPRRVAVIGGSRIPFAATGARIVATLAELLAERGAPGRGLISICAAGGQGVTAILERP